MGVNFLTAVSEGIIVRWKIMIISFCCNGFSGCAVCLWLRNVGEFACDCMSERQWHSSICFILWSVSVRIPDPFPLCCAEIGPASVMVGNLVSGKRIAQASGRDLGQIEDNDQARKVCVWHHGAPIFIRPSVHPPTHPSIHTYVRHSVHLFTYATGAQATRMLKYPFSFWPPITVGTMQSDR